jgi:hypothetical protein
MEAVSPTKKPEDRAMGLLKKGRVIESPISKKGYEVLATLGEGGFGQAYRAVEIVGKKKGVEVCLKVTKDQLGWHRESYFGELLKKNRRVIQLYESFPLVGTVKGQREILYYTVFEIAQHGSLSGYLKKNPKPWPAERAKREILALLKTLNELHGGSATHRDLTPANILVCTNGVLKLADFGIASHALGNKPVAADAFNPYFVTRGFENFGHRYWLMADDVYQMGQLFAMMLLGTSSPVLTKELSKVKCDEALKAVIKKAIGPRAKRFNDAFEMIEALEGRAEGPAGGVRSLRDKVIVFTGPLSMKRMDAEVMVLQAGGSVARQVTKETDVVVQGGRHHNYKAGHKGRKLLNIEKLNKQGANIRIIGEAEFRRLAQKPATVQKGTASRSTARRAV